MAPRGAIESIGRVPSALGARSWRHRGHGEQKEWVRWVRSPVATLPGRGLFEPESESKRDSFLAIDVQPARACQMRHLVDLVQPECRGRWGVCESEIQCRSTDSLLQ
jgi:hypothetical protein